MHYLQKEISFDFYILSFDLFSVNMSPKKEKENKILTIFS